MEVSNEYIELFSKIHNPKEYNVPSKIFVDKKTLKELVVGVNSENMDNIPTGIIGTFMGVPLFVLDTYEKILEVSYKL